MKQLPASKCNLQLRRLLPVLVLFTIHAFGGDLKLDGTYVWDEADMARRIREMRGAGRHESGIRLKRMWMTAECVVIKGNDLRFYYRDGYHDMVYDKTVADKKRTLIQLKPKTDFEKGRKYVLVNDGKQLWNGDPNKDIDAFPLRKLAAKEIPARRKLLKFLETGPPPSTAPWLRMEWITSARPTDAIRKYKQEPDLFDLRDRYGTHIMQSLINHAPVELFEWLVTQKKFNVNQDIHRGITPMHFLCIMTVSQRGEERCRKIFRIFLKAGANIHLKNKRGRTPLDSAMWAYHLPMARHADQLIAAGALKGKEETYGQQVLARYCKFANFVPVKACLEHGVGLPKPDKDGNTALHWIAMYPYTDDGLVELLVKHGANLGAVNKAGLTPLQLAQKKGHKEAIKQLEAAEKKTAGEKE